MSDDPDKLPEDTTIADRFGGDDFVVMAGDAVLWDGELLGMLKKAARQYARKFDQELPVDGLPEEQWEAALELINDALETGEAITDETFAEALASG